MILSPGALASGADKVKFCSLTAVLGPLPLQLHVEAARCVEERGAQQVIDSIGFLFPLDNSFMY